MDAFGLASNSLLWIKTRVCWRWEWIIIIRVSYNKWIHRYTQTYTKNNYFSLSDSIHILLNLSVFSALQQTGRVWSGVFNCEELKEITWYGIAPCKLLCSRTFHFIQPMFLTQLHLVILTCIIKNMQSYTTLIGWNIFYVIFSMPWW